MHRLMEIVITCAVMGMVAADLICDSQTQYIYSGQCCRKCGPGTRMLAIASCQAPECKECEEGEYQDKYTETRKCLRQTHCDQNKNFLVPDEYSKTEKVTCQCMTGFHCSSKDCLTCVPHKTCPPGFEARIVGNHSHDTVCQKCADGSFSNETSWNSMCKKWTQCKEGQKTIAGTDRSDGSCEENSRWHIIVICVVVTFLIIVIGAVLCCHLRGGANRKVKSCVESCCGEWQPLPIEIVPPVIPEDDDNINTDKDLTYPEQPSSHEESSMRTPEENEDDPSMETSAGLTDNGNYVTQENGKTEILSRQESQTQTFTD